MARITSDESSGNRIKAMWTEAGLQLRSNIITESGATIPLHAHSFDHLSLITFGWFLVEEITAGGELKIYQLASREYKPARTDFKFEPVGYRINIPAKHQHKFTLLEFLGRPAEVLCIWPE